MHKVKQAQGMTLESLKDMEFKGVTVIKGPKPRQGPTVRPSLRHNSLNSKDLDGDWPGMNGMNSWPGGGFGKVDNPQGGRG